ncbi:MAG: ATP-binding protein [Opitutales bacterium]|nr:ATP-binding protein [Opitutales bacterium]
MFHLRKSFRLRIALYSAFISFIVLISVFLITRWLLSHSNEKKLDSDIRAIGLRQISLIREPRFWEDLDNVYDFLFETQYHRDQVMIFALDKELQLIRKTNELPPELSFDKLPFPALVKRDDEDQALIEKRSKRLNSERRFGYESSNFRYYSGPVSDPIYLDRYLSDESWRLGLMSGSREYLMVAIHGAALKSELRKFETAFMASIPAVLFIAGLGGWILSGIALRPVNKLRSATQTIQSRDLHQRIPIEDEDHEFDDLIQAYNQMLERLQRSFEQATRFSSDAAHELKTPLAVLQGSIAQAMRDAEAGSDNQALFSEFLEELQRLKAITQKLLLLSKADSGQLDLQKHQMNYSEAVENLLYDIEILAPSLNVQHSIQKDIYIQADSDLLKQVLQNLCSNSIKYNKPKGCIDLSLTEEKNHIHFRIRNTISSSESIDSSRIFERFYRGDQSRSKEVDGVGLGLSISAEIINAHRGSIRVEHDQKGWITFLTILPKNSCLS